METTARHTLVGAFVLAILAGIFVAAIWLAKVEPGKKTAFYDIFFVGSVTGLAEGAAVRYNGVQIGRVDDISLDAQNVERIRVTIEVDRPAIIKEGAVASLELQGITGYAYVQVTGGSKDAPVLAKKEGERYPVIASTPSRIEKVFQSAPELLERALLIADRVAQLLDDRNRESFAATLQNIQNATAALGGQGDSLNGILVEASAAMQELRKTMASIGKLSDSVNGTIAAKDGALDKLNGALQSADAAAKKLVDFSGKLDAMVNENRPAIKEFSQRGLAELNQLIADSRQLVNGLARLAGEIERDPARFFFGDRREGYRPR